MLLACRGRQQYGGRAIDGGGAAGAGGSDRFIGHRGTFCQDFTDDLLMLLVVVCDGAAAATAAGITSGAGAGWIAVRDVLAAAWIDYIHDPNPVRTTAGSDRRISDDRSISLADPVASGGSRKICAAVEQQPTAGLRMCVGFQPVVSPLLSLSLFLGLVLLDFFSIIPLICCAPVRDHTTVCVVFFLVVSEYVCESVGRLFSSFPLLPPPRNVRFNSLVRLAVIPFLIYIFCSLALALGAVWRAPCCAALIFTGRGHYQLIDYFDCCYLIPHTRAVCAAAAASRKRKPKILLMSANA